jgi:hypothetical protein
MVVARTAEPDLALDGRVLEVSQDELEEDERV